MCSSRQASQQAEAYLRAGQEGNLKFRLLCEDTIFLLLRCHCNTMTRAQSPCVSIGRTRRECFFFPTNKNRCELEDDNLLFKIS
jgi:hypothetical protein